LLGFGVIASWTADPEVSEAAEERARIHTTHPPPPSPFKRTGFFARRG
jgi:hypothetical protein